MAEQIHRAHPEGQKGQLAQGHSALQGFRVTSDRSQQPQHGLASRLQEEGAEQDLS